MMAARQQQLWQGVLLQALRDMFRTARSENGCTAGEGLAARRWVGSRDFHMVCALAGFDGRRIEQRLRRRLADYDRGIFDATETLGRYGGAATHKARQVAA